MTGDRDSLAEQLELAQLRLGIMRALVRVANDPHRLVDAIHGAADAADALRRTQDEFSVSEEQASAVLNAQFRSLSRGDRDRLAQMLADNEADVAALTEQVNRQV